MNNLYILNITNILNIINNIRGFNMAIQRIWTALSGGLYAQDFVSPENRCAGSLTTETC
jgi:hypothetical protein